MQPSSRYTVSISVVTSARRAGNPAAARDTIPEGDGMQKNELLHLHMLMFQIRMYFAGLPCSELRTEQYDSLAISPLHLHKGRKAHARALLILGGEILSHNPGQNPPVVNAVSGTVSLPAAEAGH